MVRVYARQCRENAGASLKRLESWSLSEPPVAACVPGEELGEELGRRVRRVAWQRSGDAPSYPCSVRSRMES